MSDKFYQEEMWALVNALLTCPKFKTEKGRDDVLSLMPRISGRVERAGDNTSDALNIVQACVDIANGIDELLKQLKGFDGETIYFPEVETAAATLKARLSPPEPPPPEPSPPEPPRPPVALQQEPKFALVIGISKYLPHFDADEKPVPEQDFTPLQFAANDAVKLSELLSAHYSVDGPLIDEAATLAGIMHALDELRSKCSEVSNPTVLIYFSGHGACDGHGRSYLVPYDARRDRLFATALWNKTLDNALNELGPSRTVVFLDACHAEAFAAPGTKDAQGMPFDPNNIVQATARDRFVVASCLAGQKSYENAEARHGIFTHHLLELLRCDDPEALPEEIELSDLYGVLKTRVVQTAASEPFKCAQEPFASFQGSTGVVVALNEPLRKILMQRKQRYLEALRSRIVHNLRVKIVDMLEAYCQEGLRRPGFDDFYDYFEVSWRNTDPEVGATVEWDCIRLLDKYNNLERGTLSRIPRVQVVASAPSAGLGPNAAAAARPQTNEAAERRQPADVPVSSAKPPATGFADELGPLLSLPVSSGARRYRVDDADADYLLQDIYRNLMLREGRKLRSLLVRLEGITDEELGKWLVLTTPTGVSEEDWERICLSIAPRFREKRKEVERMSALTLRADRSE